MPANLPLMSGEGGAFRPAESCPVASVKFAGGEYAAHQGDPDSYLIADAKVADGSAVARVAVWRCAYCGVLCVGVAHADTAPSIGQAFTWLEEAVTLLGG